MVRAAFTAAIAAMWASITAIQFYYYFLNLQPAAAGAAGGARAGTTTTTTPAAQACASAAEFHHTFLTLVAAGGFDAAVALIYRHLHQAEAAAAADAGNRRVPDGVIFVLLAAAGLLVLQGLPGSVDDDVLGALGVAAFRALPGAAAATFFLGMMTLIFAAHVRAGGEGGGGAVAGDGQIREAVPLLTKMAFAAAAALVCMMAIALFSKY